MSYTIEPCLLLVFAGYYTKDRRSKSNFPSFPCTASQNGRCGASRCAVACFWVDSLHSPRPCQHTVRRGSLAPPCGHFASLVRSIAPQSARVPSETLRVSAAHLAPPKTGKPPPLPAHSFYCRSICGWREGFLKAYPPEAPQRAKSRVLSESAVL